MIDFRPAKEGELPLIWQALKNKAIFPNFEALKTIQQDNAALVQISADTGSCIGLVGSWRSHSNIGSIKALIAPDPYKKHFLQHLVSILREEGFREIVSPPLRLVELRVFYELGFKAYERVVVLKKTNLWEWSSSPSAIDICEFTPPHLSHLVDIEKASFSDFWRWDKEELISAVGAGNCFVAFFKGTPIGYNVNTIKNMDGAIARLAILPKFQRRGFGSQLLSYSLAWFKTNKVKSVFITTQITNRAAQQLYAKFGFTVVDKDRHILRLET